MVQKITLFNRKNAGSLNRVTLDADVRMNDLVMPSNPKEVFFYSNYNLPDYLFGDVLLMYYDQTQELYPIVRQKLYAEPTLDPEIQSTIESVKKGYEKAQEEISRYLDKIRDPTQIAPEFWENVDRFIQTQDTNRRMQMTPVNQVYSTKKMFPIRHINVTSNSMRTPTGKKIFKKMTIKGKGGEIAKEVVSRVDSGAEQSCIAPILASELQAKDTGDFVYLSGIDEGITLAPVVEVEVEIEGQNFLVPAAVYSKLSRVVESDFLTDAGLYISASKKGIKFVEEDK